MSIKVFCVPDDQKRAERIVVALMNAGLDVQLQCLDSSANQSVLDKCRVALFCWGQSTIGEEDTYFHKLADTANHKNIAIGVELDADITQPNTTGMTMYSLTRRQLGPHNWFMRLLIGDLFLSDIVTAARSKLAGLDPPPAVAHSQYIRRIFVTVCLSVIAIIVTIGGLVQSYNYLPIPTPKEDRAWTGLQPGSCAALTQFIAKFPNSRRAGAVQAVLAQPEIRVVPISRTSRFPVPDALGIPTAQTTESLARNAATNRLQAGAKALCDSAARNIDGQVLQATTINTSMACEQFASGWICQAKAEAQCTINEPVQTNWCAVSD